MNEIAELNITQRLNNHIWIHDKVIPGLSDKDFPLNKVIRALYRASTTGIKEADYTSSIDSQISPERRKDAENAGVAIAPPIRGGYRALETKVIANNPTAPSPETLDDLKTISLTIRRPENDGIYIPPARKIDTLADQLTQSVVESYQNATTINEAIPSISDFILLFDALHPFLDGTGRTSRGVADYMAYKFGGQFQFPEKNGHIDPDSKFIKIMTKFRDQVQQEEGYPVITSDVIKGKLGKFCINYSDLSNSFASLIEQRRANKKLRPLYEAMDAALTSMLVTNQSEEESIKTVEPNNLFTSQKRTENITRLYQEVIPGLVHNGNDMVTNLKIIHAYALDGADYTQLENVSSQITSEDHESKIKAMKPGVFRNSQDTALLNYSTTIKGDSTYEGKSFELMIPAPSDEKVEFFMNRLSTLYDNLTLEKEKISYDQAIRIAAFMSHMVATIHPFYDGNGRAARGLFTYIIQDLGFPAIFVESTDKNVRQYTLDRTSNFILDLYRNDIDDLPDYVLRLFDQGKKVVGPDDIFGIPKNKKRSIIYTDKQKSMEKLIHNALAKAGLNFLTKVIRPKEIEYYKSLGSSI